MRSTWLLGSAVLSYKGPSLQIKSFYPPLPGRQECPRPQPALRLLGLELFGVVDRPADGASSGYQASAQPWRTMVRFSSMP